jgi:hypothetical protein
MTSILEELFAWLSIAEKTLVTLEAEPLPDDLTILEVLVKDHQDFMEDMAKRQPEMDRFCRTKTPDRENSLIPRLLRSRSVFLLPNDYFAIYRSPMLMYSSFLVTSVVNRHRESLLLGCNNKPEKQGKVGFPFDI